MKDGFIKIACAAPDSTLALIVTVHEFDMLGLDRSGIQTITIPILWALAKRAFRLSESRSLLMPRNATCFLSRRICMRQFQKIIIRHIRFDGGEMIPDKRWMPGIAGHLYIRYYTYHR